jgi:hypothetical protein
MTFSEEQLKQAVEHLAFDVQHFRCYVRLHREGQLRKCSPTVSQAVIYSLLLHLRLLLDFFYGPPRYDDCWVGHFRSLPGFAAKFPSEILVPAPEDARALSVNLNKRLAHFTAIRWEVQAPAMDFYDRYFDGIENLIGAFQAALPVEIRQVFTEAIGQWERRHPAVV